MAENIPLNFFKRITVPLNRDSDSTPAYTVPSDRASIIINSLISNNSNDNRLVTISLSTANPSFPLSTGTAPRYSFTLTKELYDELIQVPEVSANLVNLVNNGLPLIVQPQNKYDIAKDVSIESLDAQNLTFSKLVLVDGDNLVAKADVEDIRTIEDPNALWEFDLPTEITSLDRFSIGFSTGSQITADFGAGGMPNTLLGTASLQTLGVNLSDGLKWVGGVLAPNGKIYGIPSDSEDILIIDPTTNTATRNTMGANLSGTQKWEIGVLANNGKIYGMPWNSEDILIIDPVANTATRNTIGLPPLTGDRKYYGGALASNGKIYGMPWNSEDILIIDPATNTATRSTMGANLSGVEKWNSGVLANNGKIYAIPWGAQDILIIDPVANTATRNTMGANLSGVEKWVGGVLASNGKIYGIPRNSEDILIIDPATNTATRSTMGANLSGVEKWDDGVLASNNLIYSMPRNAQDILIIDPNTNTAIRSTLGLPLLTGTRKWVKGVLASNNLIYSMPREATGILTIEDAVITTTSLVPLTSDVTTNYNYLLSNDTGTNLTLSILETNNQP